MSINKRKENIKSQESLNPTFGSLYIMSSINYIVIEGFSLDLQFIKKKKKDRELFTVNVNNLTRKLTFHICVTTATKLQSQTHNTSTSSLTFPLTQRGSRQLKLKNPCHKWRESLNSLQSHSSLVWNWKSRMESQLLLMK